MFPKNVSVGRIRTALIGNQLKHALRLDLGQIPIKRISLGGFRGGIRQPDVNLSSIASKSLIDKIMVDAQKWDLILRDISVANPNRFFTNAGISIEDATLPRIAVGSIDFTNSTRLETTIRGTSSVGEVLTVWSSTIPQALPVDEVYVGRISISYPQLFRDNKNLNNTYDYVLELEYSFCYTQPPVRTYSYGLDLDLTNITNLGKNPELVPAEFLNYSGVIRFPPGSTVETNLDRITLGSELNDPFVFRTSRPNNIVDYENEYNSIASQAINYTPQGVTFNFNKELIERLYNLSPKLKVLFTVTGPASGDLIINSTAEVPNSRTLGLEGESSGRNTLRLSSPKTGATLRGQVVEPVESRGYAAKFQLRVINYPNAKRYVPKLALKVDKSFDKALNGVNLLLVPENGEVNNGKTNLATEDATLAETSFVDFISENLTKTVNLVVENVQDQDLSDYRLGYALVREGDNEPVTYEYVQLDETDSISLEINPNFSYRLLVRLLDVPQITDSTVYYSIEPDQIEPIQDIESTRSAMLTGSITTFVSASNTEAEKDYIIRVKPSTNSPELFAVGYGNFNGSGSRGNLAYGNIGDSISRANYRQIARTTQDLNSLQKIDLSGSLGQTDCVYFLAINKLNNIIDPGYWQINLDELSGSAVPNASHTGSNIQKLVGGNTLQLIDNFFFTGSYDNTTSASFLKEDLRNIKDSYKIVSGTLQSGAYLSGGNPVEYGRVYPSKGLLVLDGAMLDASASFNTVNLFDVDGENAQKLYTSLGSVRMRNRDVEKGQSVFLEVPPEAYNYSMNPSFVTCFPNRPKYGSNTPSSSYGSMCIRNKDFVGSCDINTKTYITTVGLYDEDYNLLAVGKLSQAQQKARNIAKKIKIDFRY